LKELSDFLDSDERIDLLINAKSIEEIEKFLKNRR
jgi:transcriptional antiterminator, bglG